VKRISAKSILLAATVFAYGSLGPVECEGLPAEIDAAHAKVGQSANPASVGGTAERKRHRAVGSRVASSKAGARAFVVSSKSPRHRQLTVKQTHNTRLGTNGEAARKKKARDRLASGEGSKRRVAMLGLASFYSEDSETASGERFDKHKLHAAHPTLPFGTRLRVTNVRNGRSVTVRVNDRGPFVRGRIVDVTSAAAEALGMVKEGVVKVSLDFVR
jgi:peptidoglycan lytic transglycosylase